MSNEEIKILTVHQFNRKMEFLNKMFSKQEKPQEKPSNNYSILDKAYGVK